ncbi:MAG: ribonuclease Z [Flavobacteriaceae bacterium]|nr:ribonuclease Z [Flavobacteriaceae bacterium]MCB0474040.1 ribonuclease Z [Flavobacteriaceae bacterium]
MDINKTDVATLVICKNQSVEEFFVDFSKKYSIFKNENLIIDLSDVKGVKTESVLLFLQASKDHRKDGMSFVVVVNGINTDVLPSDFITVPTIVEANDIIEMENIERDLGF